MSTQNIIQGIVSPKVVSDGTGGYQVKTDIVNVDNVTVSGSFSGSFATNQCGRAQLSNGTASVSVSGVIASSIILVTKATTGGTAAQYSVNAINNSFTINSSNGSDTSDVNWFIAKF